MPNWCYTYYELNGNKEDIEKLNEKLIALAADTDGKWEKYCGNGFGNLWLGSLLGIHDYDVEKNPEELSFRGNITYFDKSDTTLVIQTETAWAPKHNCLRWVIKKHYPSIEVEYESEEDGTSYFATNKKGSFFYMYLDVDGEAEWHYLQTEDEILYMLNKIYGINLISISEAYNFIDKLPPHTRDFSRELGGFFLPYVSTYGIIEIWIKQYISQSLKMLRMVVDMCTLCNTISYGLQNTENPYS